MVIYLDQNKWIELARIVNGREKSEDSAEILRELRAATHRGHKFVLSSINLMEFAKHGDPSRRARLGEVMWEFSQNWVLPPPHDVVCREIEAAFQSFGYNVPPRELSFPGKGLLYAFNDKLSSRYRVRDSEELDRAMLCGDEDVSIPPIYQSDSTYGNAFCRHLADIKEKKNQIEKSKWDDWLYATVMKDILDPFNEVIESHRIPKSSVAQWSREGYKRFIDRLPTRRLDLHLHRQVLKNPQYNRKRTDLEDWAGLGLATCYCDVVVCEKHFADMVARRGYEANAKVVTGLEEVVRELKRV